MTQTPGAESERARAIGLNLNWPPTLTPTRHAVMVVNSPYVALGRCFLTYQSALNLLPASSKVRMLTPPFFTDRPTTSILNRLGLKLIE